MRIIMDLDEVVVQFIQPLINEYNRRYSSDITIEDITQWSLPADMCSIFHEVNFFARLIPFPGAIQGIKLLKVQGHEVILASDPSGDPHIAEQKLLWVQRWLPAHELVLTGRKDILVGDMIVDDGLHHLEKFKGCKVVMDRPWNRGSSIPNIRVVNWSGVLHAVETMRPYLTPKGGV